VSHIEVTYGKTAKHSGVKKHMEEEIDIFFEIPYWSKLDVRHCIDVMHVEKNVCDCIIGTVLNIKGKTKDEINARKDWLKWVFGWSYNHNLMVNELTCHQHVMSCQNLKRSVSVSAWEELRYHKDTLQISKASSQWKI